MIARNLTPNFMEIPRTDRQTDGRMDVVFQMRRSFIYQAKNAQETAVSLQV
jgi:hypothetical protein